MPYVKLADGTMAHYRGKAPRSEVEAAIAGVMSAAVAQLRAAMAERGRETKRPPVEHDYTSARRGWAHDYVIHAVEREGRRLRVSGFGRAVRKGDVLLLSNGEGGTPRYLVRRIEYCHDPPDMWHATLLWLPRPRRGGDA